MSEKNVVLSLSSKLMKVKNIVPDADKHKITSLIAKSAKFRGDMLLDESIYVKGSIQGSVVISGEDMILSLADGAIIRGNVKADVVVVSGTIVGNVEAKLLKLHASARIEGDISYQRILVDDGATIISSNMSKVTGQTVEGVIATIG